MARAKSLLVQIKKAATKDKTFAIVLSGLLLLVITLIQVMWHQYAIQDLNNRVATVETGGSANQVGSQLRVDELGIAFKQNDLLEDLVYFVEDIDNQTNRTNIVFTSRRLYFVIKKQNVNCEPGNLLAGSVSVQTAQANENQRVITTFNDGTQLVLNLSQNDECKGNEAVEAVRNSQGVALFSALKDAVKP